MLRIRCAALLNVGQMLAKLLGDRAYLCVQLADHADQAVQCEPSLCWQRGCDVLYRRHYGLDALSTLTEDDSKLSKLSTDRAYCHGPLSYQQTSSSVKHQEGLIGFGFYRNEPHVRQSEGLADSCSVCCIILRAVPHERLNIRRGINLTSWPSLISSRAQ